MSVIGYTSVMLCKLNLVLHISEMGVIFWLQKIQI